MSDFFYWWFTLTKCVYRDARRIEKENIPMSLFCSAIFFVVYPFMPKKIKSNALNYLIQHL